MNKFIFFLSMIAVMTVLSCRKTYTCTCTTSPAASTGTFTQQQSGGFQNQTHYSLTMWNKESAQSKCNDMYEKSGLVVNGYSCYVYDGTVK